MKLHGKTYYRRLSRLLSLLLAVSLSLAGCGNPGETSGLPSEEEGTAAVSYERPLPQIIDWSTFQMAEPQSAGLGTSWYLTENHDDWLTPVKAEYGQYGCSTTNIGTIDGTIYTNWLYRSDDETQESFCDESLMDGFDARTGQSLHMDLALGDSGLPRDAALLSMDMANDKEAVFLTYISGEPGQPIPHSALLFYHLEEGVQKTLDLLPVLASVGLGDEPEKERDYSYRYHINLCDREGRCYLIWNRSLLVIDSDGELLCHIEATGKQFPRLLCKTPEGLPLFVFPDEENHVNEYYIYDQKAGQLRSLGQSKYFNIISGCMDISGNIYYFNENGSIIRWDILSGEREKIYNCKDNHICENTYSSKVMLIRENGDLALMNPGIERRNIYVFSPIPPAETRTLTLVNATRGDSILPTAAALFSTKKPGAKIDISSFTSSGSNDLEAYTANLVNRIVAGDAPDMFVVSAQTMHTLYEKGALADLSDIFPAEMREQVFDCIWDAGTIDGKLVGLTTDQVTNSIFIPNRTYAQDTWQLKDVLELADRASGDTFKGLSPLTEYDPSPLYWYALLAIESSLVDRRSGTCHFDSEDFRRLLEYCKSTLPVEHITMTADKLSADARSIEDGEYLAYAYANYFGFSDFSLMMSSFPQDYHWVGVPTDGESGNLLYARDFLVVSKDTENMDLIREFLPTVYGEDLMRLYPERCLRRDVLRDCVRDAAPDRSHPQAEFYMSNGIIRCLECKPDGTSYVEEYIAFMDSCVLMPPEDDAIADIVMEEAEPYFAGDKDLDTVVEIIQNRVQLYLDENGS